MSISIKFTDDKGKVIEERKAVGIKTGIVDKCFDMAEKTQEIENKAVTVSEIKEYYQDVKSLLAEVFKGICSYEEIQENVSQEHMLESYNSIMSYIGITMKRKN